MPERPRVAVDEILRERRSGVLTITLNLPERLNAVSPELCERLTVMLGDLDGARAVLLRGAGKAFCSGADLKRERAADEDPGHASYRALTESYNPLLIAMADLEVPIVTAVRGAAAGIGCSLALAGDFCVASETGYFLQAFVNIGLVPDGGASWLLPQVTTRARAAALMMLGEKLPARQALDWGMIHQVVPDDRLENAAFALAARLAAGPTRALGLMRRQLAQASQCSLTQAMRIEAEHQRIARRTADSREGTAAFKEKRPPIFAGN